MSGLCYAQTGMIRDKIQFGLSVGPGYSYRPKFMSYGWPTAIGGGATISRRLFLTPNSIFSGKISAKIIYYGLRIDKDLEEFIEKNYFFDKSTVSFTSILSHLSIKITKKENPYGVYVLSGAGRYFWNQKGDFFKAIEDFNDDENRWGYLVGGGVEYKLGESRKFYIESAMHTMKSNREDEERIRIITSEFGIWF